MEMNSRHSYLVAAVIALAAVTQGCQGNEDLDEEGAGAADVSLEDAPADESSATTPIRKGPASEGKKSVCGKQDDLFEPNGSPGAAKNAPRGATDGLFLCSGDEDWFRVSVPAHTIVRVGLEMELASGDLDLVIYDGHGKLIGSRVGRTYPYQSREQETDTEYYGLYSEHGGAVYYLRVVGNGSAQNHYNLHVDHFPYVDGASCTGAGFSFDDCAGKGDEGSGLLPFPFADPQDSVVGAGYISETYSNYRFARRELIMLVRHALAETMRAFPGTKPLSLIDTCQMNGITPGYDIDDPRHPQSTHDQGGNMDISYFQTDGSNNAEIVCGDGSQHADGYCSAAAVKKHIVDLPRQAFFMAKLFDSSRTRVVGVDRVLAPLLQKAARSLAALPHGDRRRITQQELDSFWSMMAYGDGWPYHHHHIHLSMKWWQQGVAQDGESLLPSGAPQMSRDDTPAASFEMAWPPRPAAE